jgi:hypothetical protein
MSKDWIPKKLHKGRCADMGSSSCPVGSPQYNLAKTFKKHHGFHKHAEGGETDPETGGPKAPTNAVRTGSITSPNNAQNQLNLLDLMTAAIQSGKPLNQLTQEDGIRTNLLTNATMMYGQPIAQKLYSSINQYNQNPNNIGLPANTRAVRYFDEYGTDPDIQDIRHKMKAFGSGIEGNLNNTPVQQIQQYSAAPVAIKRMGGRMKRMDLGGDPVPFQESGSKVNNGQWTQDDIGITRPNYMNDLPPIMQNVGNSSYQGNIFRGNKPANASNYLQQDTRALASTLLPLNGILGKLAETNEWKQNEEYRLNYNNPLSTLGYNDGQSDGVKYGYSSYMRGGRTRYCMGGKKRYAEGGDTFEPDEFDAIDNEEPPYEDNQQIDYQQLRENNDLSDNSEYEMAMKYANEGSSILADIMNAPSRNSFMDEDSTSTTPITSGFSLRGNKNKSSNNSDTAFNYLLSKGIPQHAAAGIIGNLATESDVNPKAYNPNDLGKPSFGIAQWRGSRLKGLQNYANQNGRQVDALDTQLDYLLNEGSQRGDIQKTINTSSPEEAAKVFGSKFERPNEKYANWQKRQKIASGLLK